LLGVLVCAGTGLLVSPISWPHHYVWILPALAWLVVGSDRPARGVYWAAAATLVFMTVLQTPRGDVNVLWYVRENAYVISTVIFLALIGAMLWFRSRPPYRSEADAPADALRRRRAAPVLTSRGEPGR
jgi:alpha-1,2-mannosyltransferase